MNKPIFVDKGDSTAYFSGYCLSSSNGIVAAPQSGLVMPLVGNTAVRLPLRIPKANASKWGVLVLSKDQFNEMKNYNKQQPENKKMMKTNNNQALVYSENNKGIVDVDRIESAQGAEGTGMSLLIGFDATAAGSSIDVLLGDGSGSIADLLAPAGIVGAGVITGDRGANTLNYYQGQFQAGKYIRLKGRVTFQALNAAGTAAQGLYAQNPMRLVTVNDLKGESITNRVFNFNLGYKGDNFDLSVRYYDNFDFTLSDLTALRFTIPNGFNLQCTFTVYSFSNAAIMKLA